MNIREAQNLMRTIDGMDAISTIKNKKVDADNIKPKLVRIIFYLTEI